MARDVDLIKSKLDIVEFLRSYLKLTPAGKNFKALCPFHGEKTPSFMVSPERQTWHCFGCNLGGDVFSFIMQYENLEFPEALRYLAERAGVEIRTISPAQQREFGVLYDIHEEAAKLYQALLAKHAPAVEYLKSRGLTGETAKEFRLGYAPGGEALTLHLLKKGFAVSDLVRAGVSFKNRTGLHRDRFENRIIFPISNTVGKVVAFTGRILGESTPEIPKYLNSPESPIFTKSKILYGFDMSKRGILESRTALLVEGQMDFLMAWQSGIRNVIAVSGTGFTRDHVEKLRRAADTLIVSFDNDEAGMRALEKTVEALVPYDFHVKALSLGSYEDPAEAAQADPGFLEKAILEAKPAMKKLMEFHFAGDRDVPETKRLVRKFLSIMKKMQSSVEQNIWLKELSSHAGVGEPALAEELAEIPEKASEKEEEKPDLESFGKETRAGRIARRLVSLAFTNEGFLSTVKEKKDLLPPRYRDMLSEEGKDKGILEMRGAYESMQAPREVLDLEFKELLRELEIEILSGEQLKLKRDIHVAEGKEDEKGLETAMKEFFENAKRIQSLRTGTKNT